MAKLVERSFLVLCLVVSTLANPVDVQNEAAVRAVSDSTARFSTDFFKVVGEAKKGNLVSSPVSAALVLAMAKFGAKGETERVLKESLHLPAEDSVTKSGFQSFINLLNNVKDVELHAANKIYVDSGLDLKPSFKELTQDYFHSESESLAFSDSIAAANTINSWVAQTTQNCITDFVTPDAVQSAVMLLLNAIYFKGQWKEKFNDALTHDEPFHIDQQTVKNVSMMLQHTQLRTGDLPNLNARFVIIPYKGDEMSMVIVLPNEVDGLATIESKLQDLDFSQILKDADTSDVVLYLPKFKIESDIDLNEPLTKMGLGNMFSDAADFSGMTAAPVHVSRALQKAFIEVNEEGTEAAAVTGLLVAYTSAAVPRIPPILFKVDRPFLYAIMHSKIAPPLFIGRIQEPSVA